MSTLNVKIPDEMEDDLKIFLEHHPHYLNKSELARDAFRHILNAPQLSQQTLNDDRVSREQIDDGDVVTLDDI